MLSRLRFLILNVFGITISFLAAQQQTPFNHSKCFETTPPASRCYFLYGDRLTGVTWQTASAHCSENNQTLAIIFDDTTERDIDNFLKEVQGLSTSEIWINGRRSDDNEWKYLHSTNGEMLNGHFPSNRYCAYRSDLKVSAASVPCTDKHLPLCQYRKETTTSHDCEGGLLHATDTCLSSGLHPVTWFEARNYCRDKYQDGDLSTVIGEISDLKKVSTSGEQTGYWIGLRRRPWIWITGNGNTSIDYYFFGPQEGSDETQSCLFLKLPTDGAVYWADMLCSRSLNYYLCQEESFRVFNESSLQSQGGSNNMLVVYTVVMVIIGIALIAIGVLAILCIRRHQRMWREQNKERSPERKQRFAESGQSIRSLGLTISMPQPVTAPFPVSGYDNLGTLIPVGEDKDNEDRSSMQEEMATGGVHNEREHIQNEER